MAPMSFAAQSQSKREFAIKPILKAPVGFNQKLLLHINKSITWISALFIAAMKTGIGSLKLPADKALMPTHTRKAAHSNHHCLDLRLTNSTYGASQSVLLLFD
jgi:hypothetical protein